MPDLTQSNAQNTGEMAPKEGPRQPERKPVRERYPDIGDHGEDLPEHLQRKLYDLVRKAQTRDVFARRRELMRVQKNRFFELGFQHTWWDEDQGIFQVGQNGGGAQVDPEDDDGPLYQREIQNYAGYENSFRATFSQNVPAVRFQPVDAKNGADITAAQEAGKHKRVIEKFNNPKELQDDVGRLLWTDGSAFAYTRFVTDGQRFGFEEDDAEEDLTDPTAGVSPGQGAGEPGAGDSLLEGSDLGGLPGAAAGDNARPDAGPLVGEHDDGEFADGEGAAEAPRTPKGREIISIHGVLECKRPLSIRDPHRWPYFLLSLEDDISILKSEYPDIEDRIKPGGSAPGAENRARLARIACSQGSSWEGNSESTLEYLITRDRCWFRPAFFNELGGQDDPDRQDLEELFPDGVFCVFIGELYCESRNESFEAHINNLQAKKANGQNVPGFGNALIDPCEAFDDMFNMAEEAFKNTIPMKIFRNGALDLEAIREQGNAYGSYIEGNPNSTDDVARPFSDNFFEETPIEPPAQMMQMMTEIQGPLMQFLSSQLAPIMGQSDEHNETAKGISILRDQALGLMSLVWTPFTNFYGEVMVNAIRCGAENRNPEKPFTTLVDVPGKKAKEEPVTVNIEDLQGNIMAAPVVDANFPESWTSKSNRFLGLMSATAQNPMLAKLLSHPDNQVLAKDMVGLEDMEFPDADAVDKQIEEIARLSKASPIPPSEEEVAAQVKQEIGKLQQTLQQGAAAGVQVPQVDAEQITPKLTQQAVQQLTKSSVEVDPICDNHAVEAEECLRWINSPTGQKMKNSEDDADKQGFQNVRLHLLEHQAVLKQQAQQAAMAAMAQQTGAAAGAAPAAGAGV